MKIKFDSANILTDKEYIKSKDIIPIIPKENYNPRWWIKPNKLKRATDILYIYDYFDIYTPNHINKDLTQYTKYMSKTDKPIHYGSISDDYGIRPILLLNKKEFKKIKKEYKQIHKEKLMPGKECIINNMKFTLLKDLYFIPFLNKFKIFILNDIYVHHSFRNYLYALYNNKKLSSTKELRDLKQEYQDKYEQNWNDEFTKDHESNWYNKLNTIYFKDDSWTYNLVNKYEDSCVKRIVDFWFNQNFKEEVEIIF